MEGRIEFRKKDFKKAIDDPLRLREDQHVQIRKTAREAHLAKKRSQVSQVGHDVSTAAPSEPAVVLDDLPELAKAMYSPDDKVNFHATQQIRRLLSVENHPPIQAVIDRNLVPRFVEMLQWDHRPDLQFEAAWALTNIASGSRDQTSTVMEAGAIPVFVRLLDSPRQDVREQAIWALGNIAGDGPDFRDVVLQAGAMPSLLRELQTAEQPDTKISLIRYGTWTLSNFCRGKPEPSMDTVLKALPVLRTLLYAMDTEILTDACWAVSYLSDLSDDPCSNCIDQVLNSGLCGRLVELLNHNSYLVQTPALRAVGNIVTGDDPQTSSMIQFGCLPKLKALLSSHRKTLRKEACWAISNITAGSREQIEDVIEAGIIGDLVKLLENGEYEVKREAAWAISNAASGGNVRQITGLVDAGCLPPLVGLLDVHDQKVVAVALEAIENILKTGKARMEEEGLLENPYVDELDQCGGLNKLESMQDDPTNAKVYQAAMKIMREYLDVEEANDGVFGNTESYNFGGMN